MKGVPEEGRVHVRVCVRGGALNREECRGERGGATQRSPHFFHGSPSHPSGILDAIIIVASPLAMHQGGLPSPPLSHCPSHLLKHVAGLMSTRRCTKEGSQRATRRARHPPKLSPTTVATPVGRPAPPSAVNAADGAVPFPELPLNPADPPPCCCCSCCCCCSRHLTSNWRNRSPVRAVSSLHPDCSCNIGRGRGDAQRPHISVLQ